MKLEHSVLSIVVKMNPGDVVDPVEGDVGGQQPPQRTLP